MIQVKSEKILAKYRDHYKKYGWVSIPNVFKEKVVENYCKIIKNINTWELVTLVNGKPFIVAVEELRNKPQEFINRFVGDIVKYASEHSFQYFYENVRLDEEYNKDNEILDPFHQLCDSSEFLDFLKTVTNDTSSGKVFETQITRFSAGSFLKEHTDHNPENPYDRKFAFVIGLTNSWKPDWGGLLNIIEDEDNLYQSLIPQFNNINIFKVPRQHFVSQVSNFCPQSRISISGWVATKNKS